MQRNLFAVMPLGSPVVLSYLHAGFEPRCGLKDLLSACLLLAAAAACCLLKRVAHPWIKRVAHPGTLKGGVKPRQGKPSSVIAALQLLQFGICHLVWGLTVCKGLPLVHIPRAGWYSTPCAPSCAGSECLLVTEIRQGHHLQPCHCPEQSVPNPLVRFTAIQPETPQFLLWGTFNNCTTTTFTA